MRLLFGTFFLGILSIMTYCSLASAMPSFRDSPQFQDDKFRNPAAMQKRSVGDMARIWWTFLFNKPTGTVPRQPVPVRSLSREALLERSRVY